MDPDVRAVFEECLRADPPLAEHVSRLIETRLLLCQYGCQCRAPRGMQARLRRQLYCEMMRTQAPLFPSVVERLREAATYTSAVAIFLAVCLIAGSQAVLPDERELVAGLESAADDGRPAWVGYRQASAILLPHATSSPMRSAASVSRSVLAGTFAPPHHLPAFDTLRIASRLKSVAASP